MDYNKKRTLVTCLVCSIIFLVIFNYDLIPLATVKLEEVKVLELKDLDGLAEDDEMLLAFTRQMLVKPSSGPYFLSKPGYYNPEYKYIVEKLRNRRNGFFIDCGAFDGEDASVTLPMEMNLNWRGILVEPAPRNFFRLRLKNRKSWILPICMSTTTNSTLVSYLDSEMHSRIIDHDRASSNSYALKTICVPFHTIARAMGVKKVDFFKLDVQGAEMAILKTIDFNRVTIDVF
ncbi:Hypothetical predicted protein [Cloeon dipterum]|uniref:Methyltransferase FkbM domain-containing protein n=2 Tax=Cloeon dipterum TaxID=197152 RepID=A0A8S1DZH9_9INSE|nr:Hypothetical predicted protein [Cloeon dipterum]